MSQLANLLKRIGRGLNAWHLRWALRSIRARMDRLEGEMANATELVLAMSRLHQVSPYLNAQRRAMRDQHAALHRQWVEVQRQLDTLEARS